MAFLFESMSRIDRSEVGITTSGRAATDVQQVACDARPSLADH